MMNQLQVQGWIFDLVVGEGLPADSVSQRIRREDIDVYKLISKGPEQQAQSLRDQWDKAYGPIARNYMQMTNSELKLRGDLIAALHLLETTNPHEIREVIRHIQILNDQDRETWMAPGQPPYVLDAISALEESGVDGAPYRAVLDALYPAVTDEDDAADEPDPA